MFFKSLLPHAIRILAIQKLTFRYRLQELVQHFAYLVTTIFLLQDTHGSTSSVYLAPQIPRYSPMESHIYTSDITTLLQYNKSLSHRHVSVVGEILILLFYYDQSY